MSWSRYRSLFCVIFKKRKATFKRCAAKYSAEAAMIKNSKKVPNEYNLGEGNE